MTQTRKISESKLRAGVIGVGNMGKHHARVYNELPGVTLVGVSDIDRKRARDVAKKYGAQVRSERNLLHAADIVSIVAPTHAHYEIARNAIEQGVDILVEKPLVNEISKGKKLVEFARSNGCILQVGHIERFNPAIITLDDIVAGLEVISVKAERLGPPLDRKMEDSVVMDLMIHDIDVVLSLLQSDVSSVAAFSAEEGPHVTAVLKFATGVLGSFIASRITQQKVRTLSITARECQVNVDYLNQSIEIHRHSLPSYIEKDGNLRYRHESIIERPTISNGEPLKNELASFAEAVRTRTSPEVTGEDALRAIRVAGDIERAVTDEREVPAR